jgi:heme/copper-type cytochrome/quinol oxidase subunit 2
MSKKILSSSIVALFFVPIFAYASDVFDMIDLGVDALSAAIPLTLSLSIVIFLWGVVKFVSSAGDEKAIEEGRQIIVWGMVAIFVIVSLWGIIGFITETLDLDTPGGDVIGIPTVVP